jgi:hypothetical protein
MTEAEESVKSVKGKEKEQADTQVRPYMRKHIGGFVPMGRDALREEKRNFQYRTRNIQCPNGMRKREEGEE